MQIGRFHGDEGPALALRVEGQWVNLTRIFADLEERRGREEPVPLDSLAQLLALDGCNREFYARIRDFCDHSGRLAEYQVDGPEAWLAPAAPGKVVAVGRNYRAHALELGNPVPASPVLFVKTPNTIVGPGEAIPVDPSWGRVDHEGEIAILIGQRTSRISAAEARNAIAGYLLLNDVTARDMQSDAKKNGLPWFVAKNLDGFCPVGPVVTLADAVPWPPQLDLTVHVNGSVRQQGNTRDFLFPLDQLIAHISSLITLEAGDLIATGTPEGVGPLVPGDTVTVSCPELGTLANVVTAR